MATVTVRLQHMRAQGDAITLCGQYNFTAEVEEALLSAMVEVPNKSPRTFVCEICRDAMWRLVDKQLEENK